MNLTTILSCFADDALVIDPHYPEPRMQGKAAISAGLLWAFGSMRKMGFKIIKYYEAPDGTSAAVEIDTAHVLKSGMKLRFPQVFIIDVRDGKVTRLQAYEPYGPNGVGALLLGLARLQRRFKRR